MQKVLTSHFFQRPTLAVAKELLGKFLVRKIRRKRIVGMIIDVEAYVGLQDKASHASRGKTERTKVMFGKPGFWYVYLVYGMHYCLNIVTEKEGYPAAILIRGVRVGDTDNQVSERNENTSFHFRANAEYTTYIRGPGRVSKYFHIDKSLNTKKSERSSGLWIEDRGIKIKPRMIMRGKRIGVEYAGKWKEKLWRYHLETQFPSGNIKVIISNHEKNHI